MSGSLDFSNPAFLLWLLAGSFELVWDLTGAMQILREQFLAFFI
jgi:hypothetical protein